MSGRVRAARATGVAAAVVAPGALAHLAAGGALSLLPALLGFAALAAVVRAADRIRWTFPRLVLAAAAAQPLLHDVFAAGRAPAGPGAHAGHAGHTVAASHADGWMVAAHLVATLVVAIALRWGVRWLRTLPAIARALVLPKRGVPVPYAARVRLVPAAPTLPRNLAVLAVRGSRGPPR